ncbi:hypothetical protein [Corynebacterium gottingense]|uniref:Uncharacterized protein n=1 Tax=Corynebacterium gottingense TaxID=2041036 RepID=A0ABX9UKR5_9CORY|nr:hypothetical protein [Corynebacterium gottingense]RMD20052.1 hypothetical protein EAW56_03780 [Corynebacterium gottingense]WJZ13683.1 hypothetical protein CGOTT_08845 [Corynebacterium gottingense]WJZ15998.1 hypothetical protein CGOTTB_08795 [Corynebacterium gottingense]
MGFNHRSGIAVGATITLLIGMTNPVSAGAQEQEFPVVESYAAPVVDFSQPVRIEGNELVLMGNRIPLVNVAVGSALAVGSMVGIGVLIARAGGCSGSSNGDGGSTACGNGSQRRTTPKFGGDTIYDDDGDQARVNPLARGANSEETKLLFPRGEDQVGEMISLPTSTITDLGLVEGTVLSLPPSEAFPVGQLVKISDVESAGEDTTFATAQADLSDIILETDGEFSLTGTPGKFEVEPAPNTDLRVVGSNDGYIPHDSGTKEIKTFEYKKDLKPEVAENVQEHIDDFSVNGSIGLEAEWTFDKPLLKPADYSLAITDSVSTDFTLKASREFDFDKKVVFGKAKGQFWFFPGGVPVVLNWKSDIGFRANASVEGEFSFQPSLSHTQRIGVQYAEGENGGDGKIEPILDLTQKPEVNGELPEMTAKSSIAGGPELTLEATMYRLIGVGGAAWLKLQSDLAYDLMSHVLSGSTKWIFKPDLEAFVQPLTEHGRQSKKFPIEEFTIWEESGESGLVGNETEPSQPTDTTKAPEPENEDSRDGRTLTGVVRAKTVKQLTGKVEGPNGESSKSRFYVLELDKPTALTGKKLQDTLTRENQTEVSLGSFEDFGNASYGPIHGEGDWPSLVGKKVEITVDPEKSWWQTDAGMPLGLLRVSSKGAVTNVKLVKTGECSTAALTETLPGMDRPSVTWCDGNFARVGQKNTDWIINLEHKDGTWTEMRAAGTRKYGLASPCYREEDLQAALMPREYREQLLKCSAEDVGYFPH